MKLHFSKNENGDILVQIEQGTILINFNYIEMLSQLIIKNEIEESEWGNLDEEERLKLRELLQQITNAVKEGLEKPLE